MTKLMSTTAAIAVILAGATSAHAEVRRLMPVSMTITYSDTELASARNANLVLHRIDNAATALCAPNSPVGPSSRSTRRCIAQAVRRAVATLGAPMVTAAYARRNPTAERVLAAR